MLALALTLLGTVMLPVNAYRADARTLLQRSPLSEPSANGTALVFGGPRDEFKGDDATGIDALVNGACGYGRQPRAQWPYWQVATINNVTSSLVRGNASPKGGCGVCVQVTCSQGAECATTEPMTVLITGTCTSCKADELEVHYSVFARLLTDPARGTLKVQYAQVECQPEGPIVVFVDEYNPSTAGFLAISLRNVAGLGGIETVELRGSPNPRNPAALADIIERGGGWAPMRNVFGAVWQLSLVPAPPWDLRITGSEVLIARAVIPSTTTDPANMTFSSNVQFSTSSSAVYLGQPGSMLPATPPVSPQEAIDNTPGSRIDPSPGCAPSLATLLSKIPEASTFLKAANSTGLSTALQMRYAAITVLVPTNVAFRSVPVARLDFSDTALLQSVLLFHIIPQPLLATDVGKIQSGLSQYLVNGSPSMTVSTSNGANLNVSRAGKGLFFRGRQSAAQSVHTDILSCRSVVHTINNVLLP